MYPSSIDVGFNTDRQSEDIFTSDAWDLMESALKAIETELGTDPAGASTDVKTLLAGVTAAEMGEIANIGTTTISAAQWGYLGACGAGGGQLLAALTTGESTQLETIGATTISAAQWGYLGAMTKDPLGGDATAGRVLRQVYFTIANGTNASTLKCTLNSIWNGDTIGETDNVAKGATTGNFTLNAGGTELIVEAAGLSGNCLFVIASLRSNASGVAMYSGSFANANDILVQLNDITTGAQQDMTILVDTGTIDVHLLYLTSA